MLNHLVTKLNTLFSSLHSHNFQAATFLAAAGPWSAQWSQVNKNLPGTYERLRMAPTATLVAAAGARGRPDHAAAVRARAAKG